LEIGEILGLKNVHVSIKNFDEDDLSLAYSTDSLGRNKKSIMLTDQGLYKLLFISRVPIAKHFQNWVFGV
jgi:prophage antirepressor-like protein